MDYLVTISMPVYNVRNFVERSLMSALNQTFEYIEFLIVDDCGYDGSMEIVYNIKKRHPRGMHIRIVEHKMNAGLGMTRNTAIEEAKGQYLFFMDSDDYIAPNTIELLYSAALKYNTDVAIACDYNDLNGVVFKRYQLPNKTEKGKYAVAKWMMNTKLYFPIHTWNKLYRVDFLRSNNIHCIVGHMVEDTWFTFQVVMKAQSITSVNDYTYYYNINPYSHSRQQRDEKFFQQYIEIFNARKQLLSNEKGSLPKVLYNYFLDPFFSFFVREAITKKKRGKYSSMLLEKIQEIYTMDFYKSDIVGLRFKILYILFQRQHYNIAKLFYFLDDKICGGYTKIGKFLNIHILPYHHL